MSASGFMGSIMVLIMLTPNSVFASRRIDRLERLIKSGFETERLTRETDMMKLIGEIAALETFINVTVGNFVRVDVDKNGDDLDYVNTYLNDLDTKIKYLKTGAQQEKSTVRKLKRSVSDLTSMYQRCMVADQSQNHEQVVTSIASLEDSVKKSMTRFEDILQTMEQTFTKELESFVRVIQSSCLELMLAGAKESGVYWIQPGTRQKPVRVYCDQETNGGGWTVFQRRRDGSVDFYRYWRDYKAGFGDLEGDFWLGNDLLHEMTRPTTLRVDLRDLDDASRYAEYNIFSVSSEIENYKINVAGYSGTVSDSLYRHDGMQFSTRDRQNDESPDVPCAEYYQGAWWFTYCHRAHLNGKYIQKGDKAKRSGSGIRWIDWHAEDYHSLPFSEMKFR